MRQYILLHDKRHPQEMGMPEVDAFLPSKRFAGAVGAWKRAEAKRAIQFLYEDVLDRRWPRGTQDGAGKRRRAKKAVYLNGQQPGVNLLDRMRNAIRVRQYALETETAYVDWTRTYILFHQKQHPREMGAMEVEQFLTHLAVQRQVSPSTQKQALCALAFLYETVLAMELGQVMPVRGRHGQRIPVVMSRSEVAVVLDCVRPAKRKPNEDTQIPRGEDGGGGGVPPGLKTCMSSFPHDSDLCLEQGRVAEVIGSLGEVGESYVNQPHVFFVYSSIKSWVRNDENGNIPLAHVLGRA